MSLFALHPDHLLQTGLEIIVGSLAVGVIVGVILGIATFLSTRGDRLSSTREVA